MRRVMHRFLVVLVAFVTLAATFLAGHGSAIAASTTASSTNLEDFLTSVTITGLGEPDSNGVYHYRNGQEVQMSFVFAENSKLQFDNDNPLTYPLPSGFEALATGGDFNIDVETATGVKTVKGNTWQVKDGKLVIQWNKTDPNYDSLIAASNTKIPVSLSFKMNNVDSTIKFSDTVTKKFEVDNSSKLSVNKTGRYDSSTGKVYYTVTVQSTGTNTNVNVADTITGTALTYDPSSFAISGNSSSYTGGTSGNGYNVTLASMKDGETVTITYAADVKYDKIAGSSATFDETNNTVKVKSHENPTPEESHKDFNHEITPTSVTKTGKASTDVTTSDGRTYRPITWTIDANSEKHESLAGSSITDTIAADSQKNMKYSGTGITIGVYDKQGNLVETRKVSWADLGVTDLSSATSWKYQVPSSDGIYEYKISYTTRVDITDNLVNQTVKNEVTTKGDTKGSGSVDVTPGFTLTTKKTATKITRDNITWKFTISVPKAGYDTLTATDSFPTTWLNNKNVYDSLVDGSVVVDGLTASESYKQEVTEKGLTLTFYKDKDKTKTGVNATDSDRTITVTLTTKNNEEWLKAVSDGNAGSHQETHTNNVDVTANNTTVHGSADANPPTEQSITKSGTSAGTVSVDGTDLPVYRYELVLTGVNKDSLDITDTFDTSILKYYASSAYDAGHIYGGTQYGQYEGNVTFTTSATSSGMTIHVASVPKNANGNYYSHYKLVYYLIVKDKAALNTLKAKALSDKGTATLSNTAQWDSTSSTAKVTYNYKPLTKSQTAFDGNRTATYTVKLNPDGLDIDPHSDTLTMTDVMSDNLFLDVSSIKVDPSAHVTYDYDRTTNTLTVTFPDETPVTLTYNAVVESTGNVNYSNTATLNGSSTTVNNSAKINGSASGTASIPSIKILKYTYGDLSDTIAGAQFQLYKASDNSLVSNKVFTTDSKGVALIEGRQNIDGWTLEKGVKYYLKEVKAPEGYTLRDDKIYFTLSDSLENPNEYLTASTIPFWNKRTNFAITKVNADDKSVKLEGATFRLTGQGAVSSYDQSVTTNNKGLAPFAGLLPGTYKLTETKAPDGYVLDKTEYTVVVDSDLKVSSPQLTFTADGDIFGVQISNKPQGQPIPLPSVGGSGVMGLFAGGLGFIFLAAGVEILRRRHETVHTVSSRVHSAHGRHV